ncbi:hypothetical protein Pla22_51450 [Rubripirellula amarantea]|uniref:Uncharacterized protein n=1 Tax=Rubripirellula amarantea TaxID=2527999 RepID=A0A5C5WBX3_9BACT|nr:hypothetical protein Pla22_51450 [Rubripirellula amarantea]
MSKTLRGDKVRAKEGFYVQYAASRAFSCPSVGHLISFKSGWPTVCKRLNFTETDFSQVSYTYGAIQDGSLVEHNSVAK